MRNEKISPKVLCSVIATGILAFCGVLAETALNVAFPTLKAEFQVDTSTVQWLVTVYLLVLAIMVPLSGFFKNSFKNKVIFLMAIGLFLVGIIIAGTATNFPILLVGRVIQGMGTGIGMPLMFNIILEQIPFSKLGIMMGIGTMIPAIAPAIGPTFGGLVISNLSWRYIFFLLIPIIFGALVLGMLTIEQRKEVVPTKFDVVSLVFVAVMFVGIILGFNQMANFPFFSLQVGGAFLAGILGMSGFVFRSKQIGNPLLELKLLGNSRFRINLIAYFIIQLVLMGLVFILPNYVQLVNGSTAQVSGLVVFPGATLGALFTPIGGRILDRFGAKRPILSGCWIILSSLILFLLFSNNLSNLMIGAFYFTFTMGIGFSYGNLMTNGLTKLEQEQQADGNAFMMTFQQFAGASGTAIVATILSKSQAVSGLAIDQTTVNGSRISFILLIGLMVVTTGMLMVYFSEKNSKLAVKGVSENE